MALAGGLPPALRLVSPRRIVIYTPTIRIALDPADRVLVAAGDAVVTGTPLAERTPDAAVVDVGPLDGTDATPWDEDAARAEDRGSRTDVPQAPQAAPAPAEQAQAAQAQAAQAQAEQAQAEQAQAPAATGLDARGSDAPSSTRTAEPASNDERRSPAFAGKWWVGGEERKGRLGRHYLSRRLAGPLLFEHAGRWRAAAGERHETVEAPMPGIVRTAISGVEVTLEVSGAGMIAAVAAGAISRGRLDVAATPEADLRSHMLDVGRAGAIVVGGSRIDAEALTRARAMGIRGLVASSISSADLRDMRASEARQRASLHSLAPFAALGIDGYVRRPIPSPVLDLLRALDGRDVAISTDPPMLLFDPSDLALPSVAPDWVRVRSGPLAGREGRWLAAVGVRRFRSGANLQAATVRFSDEQLVVPVNDLERFEI